MERSSYVETSWDTLCLPDILRQCNSLLLTIRFLSFKNSNQYLFMHLKLLDVWQTVYNCSGLPLTILRVNVVVQETGIFITRPPY